MASIRNASLMKSQESTLVKLVKLKQDQFVHRKMFFLRYCSMKQSSECKCTSVKPSQNMMQPLKPKPWRKTTLPILINLHASEADLGVLL